MLAYTVSTMKSELSGIVGATSDYGPHSSCGSHNSQRSPAQEPAARITTQKECVQSNNKTLSVTPSAILNTKLLSPDMFLGSVWIFANFRKCFGI